MFPHFDQSEYAVALKNAYRQFPAKDSTLDIDFINNRQRVAGVQGAALDGVTFTRSTTGKYFDATGTMQTAAINAARFEYDPVSLRPLGLLIEESRSNSIRNNTMAGAVAGTLPTHWTIYTPLTGLTSTVVGTGTSGGVTYIDLRIQGTPSAGGSYYIYHETVNAVAATAGQSWAHSAFFALVSGSLAGVTAVALRIDEINSGGSYLATRVSGPLNIGASLLRQSVVYTVGSATTASIQPIFLLTLSGAAVDLTLRIGMPQLELGAFATSVIATSGTSVTRGADVPSMTGANFSSWYNQSIGSIFATVTLKSVAGISSIALFDDATANEIISVRGNTSNPELYIVDGGVVQAQIDAGTLAAYTSTNLASAWQMNDAAISQNGQPSETDSSLTLPTPTQLRIGSDGTNYFNGWISRLVYYPKRLPNNLLQYLSRLTA